MITIKAHNAVNASRLVKAVLLEFPDQTIEVEILKPRCRTGAGVMGAGATSAGGGVYGSQDKTQGAQ